MPHDTFKLDRPDTMNANDSEFDIPCLDSESSNSLNDPTNTQERTRAESMDPESERVEAYIDTTRYNTMTKLNDVVTIANDSLGNAHNTE